MLRIITDTGSDVTYLGAPALGMESVELGVQFEDFSYDYRNDTDFSVFYEALAKAKNLPTTSQVTPGQYLDLFEDAKAKGDEVLVVTISSEISGTYQSAIMAQEMSGYEGISVVDSHLASVGQRMLAEYAVRLREAGKGRLEIAEALEQVKSQVVFGVLMDSLKYLKKGGRVSPAMGILGELLHVKPTVTMREGKIVTLGKARGTESAKQVLWNQFEADGYDESWPVYFGYTYNKEMGEAFMQETKEKFGLTECILCSVGGVIGTHGGPNNVAIGYKKK